MTRYKTISLYYGNGESELISDMAAYGWGLIFKLPPDYVTGNKEAHYTFVGGDNAKDVKWDFYSKPRIKVIEE